MDADNPWDGDDGEELEAEIMRADHPFGVVLRGTTSEEAVSGLSKGPWLVSDPKDGRSTK